MTIPNPERHGQKDQTPHHGHPRPGEAPYVINHPGTASQIPARTQQLYLQSSEVLRVFYVQLLQKILNATTILSY